MKRSLEDVFRENLKFYRQKAKISQEKLSDMLDKNINYITTIECGKSVPPLSVIDKIADILGVEAHYLLEPLQNEPAFTKYEFAEKVAARIQENSKAILLEMMKDS